MARTTTVRQFLYSVGVTLVDVSPQFSFWTEQELVYYANLGQRAIAKYLPQAGSRVDAIKLRPGTHQDLTTVASGDIRPGDGSTAATTYGISLLDVICGMGADGQTAGKTIRLVDRHTKDVNDEDWHSRTGTPREYMYDKDTPKTFLVTPGVTGTFWARIAWMAEPIAIPAGGPPGTEVYPWSGANAALLGINDQFVDDLHNYVVAMACLKKIKNAENSAKGQMHMAMFTQSINAQAAVLTGTSPNLTALPFFDQVKAGAV